MFKRMSSAFLVLACFSINPLASDIPLVQTLINPDERAPSPTDAPDDSWVGASVAQSGQLLAVGAQYWTNAAQLSVGATYVFSDVGDTWHMQAQLLGPDSANQDGFGAAVAVVGNRILVGAPYADTEQGQNAGAIYSYVHDGSSWNFEQKLTRASGNAGDYFGGRIWVVDDWVFVSARYADSPSANVGGVVRVYRATPSGLDQVQDLSASDAQSNDRFGMSLAVQDGLLYVGAGGVDLPGVSGAGAVYRFTLAGGAWSQLDRFTAPVPTTQSFFGSELAADSHRLAVAQPAVDATTSATAGRVHVFDLGSGTPVLMTTLSRNGAGLATWYGQALGLSGDDLFVSNTALGTANGRVIRYRYSAGNWNQAEVMADVPEVVNFESDWFGYAITTSTNRVLIGAPLSLVGDFRPGGVFEYRRDANTAWRRTQFIKTQERPSKDQFGHAISLNGDAMLISRVKDETTVSRRAGSVDVLRRQGQTWHFDQRLICEDGNPDDRCGSSVLLTDDFAFVGANSDDFDGKVDAGSVFAFKRLPDGSFSAPQTLRPPTLGTQSFFGASLAADGQRLLVGASGHRIGNTSYTGTVFAYQRVGDSWQLLAELVPLSPESELYFGASIQLDADRLLVTRSGNATNPIVAQVYQWVTGQWQLAQTIPAPPGTFLRGSAALLNGSELFFAMEGSMSHYRETAGQWQYQSTILSGFNDPGFGRSAALRGRNLIVSGSNSIEQFHLTSNGWIRASAASQPLFPERYGVALDNTTLVVGSPQRTGTITGLMDSGEALVFEVMPFDGGFE